MIRLNKTTHDLAVSLSARKVQHEMTVQKKAPKETAFTFVTSELQPNSEKLILTKKTKKNKG